MNRSIEIPLKHLKNVIIAPFMWAKPWKQIARQAERSFEYMMEHDLVQSKAPAVEPKAHAVEPKAPAVEPKAPAKEDHMDHFFIYHANRRLYAFSDEFHEAYAADVERLMIPWIREEERSGRLRDRELWRPFRDAPEYDRSLMGYHRLFVYHPSWLPTGNRSYRGRLGPCEVPAADGTIPRLVRVYFMLCIAPYCYQTPDEFDQLHCAACNADQERGERPNFVAALYGWEEDDTPILKPYVHFNLTIKGTIDAYCPVVPSIYWDHKEDEQEAEPAEDSDSSVE